MPATRQPCFKDWSYSSEQTRQKHLTSHLFTVAGGKGQTIDQINSKIYDLLQSVKSRVIQKRETENVRGEGTILNRVIREISHKESDV